MKKDSQWEQFLPPAKEAQKINRITTYEILMARIERDRIQLLKEIEYITHPLMPKIEGLV